MGSSSLEPFLLEVCMNFTLKEIVEITTLLRLEQQRLNSNQESVGTLHGYILDERKLIQGLIDKCYAYMNEGAYV